MIDNDPALREMTAEVLERDGHQVIALSGGAELTGQHERWADCILLDMSERLVLCGGREIRLTRGEYALLEMLALHPGQTFSREQLYERAFGYDGHADAATVTEHIRSIRAKLNPVNPIETVWGVGYKWKERGNPSA